MGLFVDEEEEEEEAEEATDIVGENCIVVVAVGMSDVLS